MKERKDERKLTLSRQTVTNLSKEALKDIRAGGDIACWENLWTLYHCDVIYTRLPE
jgi:hypothetical protein